MSDRLQQEVDDALNGIGATEEHGRTNSTELLSADGRADDFRSGRFYDGVLGLR